MMKLMVRAVCEPGGRVALRICRRKTENPEDDAAPIPLDHGVLDIPLGDTEMAEIHRATGEALWDRMLRIGEKA